MLVFILNWGKWIDVCPHNLCVCMLVYAIQVEFGGQFAYGLC